MKHLAPEVWLVVDRTIAGVPDAGVFLGHKGVLGAVLLSNPCCMRQGSRRRAIERVCRVSPTSYIICSALSYPEMCMVSRKGGNS